MLERLQQHGTLGECGPRLNEERDAEYWFSQPGAPKPALDNEKPQGETVDYETLLSSWTAQGAEMGSRAVGGRVLLYVFEKIDIPVLSLGDRHFLMRSGTSSNSKRRARVMVACIS